MEIYSSGNVNGTSNNNQKDFVLKREAANTFSMYQSTGSCVIRPYPVFDANGNPCPPRMPSSYEIDGQTPNIEAMSKEDLQRYYSELIPDAFTCMPLASYTGRGKITLIDYCKDTQQYADQEYLDANGTELMPTPYTVMYRKINATVPTDKYRGDGFAPIPEAVAALAKNNQNAAYGLGYPRNTIMFRGCLIQIKGAAPTGKRIINGVHPAVLFVITTASAVASFTAGFANKIDKKSPIGPDNFLFKDMFQPEGDCLTIKKSGPQNSDPYDVDTDFDKGWNDAVIAALGATNYEDYFLRIRNTIGAFPSVCDMLNIMTVQQQFDLMVDQFPASWVVYGMLGTPYEKLITPELRAAAEKDQYMRERLGLPPIANASQVSRGFSQHNSAQAPAPSGFNQPTAATVKSAGGFGQPSGGFGQAATVNYQPQSAGFPQQGAAPAISAPPIPQPDAVPMGAAADQNKADADKAAFERLQQQYNSK